MRRLLAILTVVSMLGMSGIALAQDIQTPAATENDVSHEMKDDQNDPNGLPPDDETVPSAILDSHAYTGGGAVLGVGGPYFPTNEWVMPHVFPDGQEGRDRDVILPGVSRLNAMYGNWVDRDGDESILFTNETDPDNEWTFENMEPDGTNVSKGVRAYIYPGYYPPTTSDCYILGYKYLGESFCYLNDTVSDLEYSYVGNGEWRNSWAFFDDDGSLLSQVEIHTVANGADTNFKKYPDSNREHGYQCPVGGFENDSAPCLVDIDLYDVLNDDVAGYYAVVTEIQQDVEDEVDATYDEYLADIVEPILDPLVATAVATANNATGTVFRDEPNEADPDGPHPSMTGIAYADGPHAYLDIRGAAAYPFGVLLTWQTMPGMPTREGFQGQGFAPHIHTFMGYLHIWEDADNDGNVDEADEYWQGICDIKVNGVATTSFNITLEAVDDDGEPTTWGTTGVYVLRDEEFGIQTPVANISALYLDESVNDVLDDLQVDQYVLSGPITIPVTCDSADPGDFFGDRYILFPEGNREYNLRAKTDVIEVTFGDPSGGGTFTETVQDVDFHSRWNNFGFM